MAIKMMGRYEPGSKKERAHRVLKEFDVKVDHVYGVDTEGPGMEEITFTFGGRAQTAFVENGRVVHVMDGWDVLTPKAEPTRRGG